MKPGHFLDLAPAIEAVYVLTGLVLAWFALATFADASHPRRNESGAFWLMLAALFALGKVMPHRVSGVLILAMVVLDGLGRVVPAPGGATGADPAGADPTRDRAGGPAPLGHWTFVPVLLIPLTIFAVAIVFRAAGFDPSQGAILGMGAGSVAGMAGAMLLTGDGPRAMMQEGRRINETMGTVSILPQLLASLGAVFVATHMGDLIAAGLRTLIPADQLFLLILANCAGMAALSLMLGNSFAAFPVIATGVLVPLIVRPFHVDPSLAAILTLTSGASGTLMTPMAANFNLVPAALLELRSPYRVIRFQTPAALLLLAYHIVVMWLLITLAR